MPRGKKKTSEILELPIIETTNEEGQIPYFIIDDEWGISCDERQEILVRKKLATKTIKNEEELADHIETYYLWTSNSYLRTFTEALETYYMKTDRIKKNNIKKSTNINDLIDIQKEIYELINKALCFNGINKTFLSSIDILNEKAQLKETLTDIKNLKTQIETESEKLMQLIREKRSIIVKNTEPKKHRIKEEE
jgi:hypothetical protein